LLLSPYGMWGTSEPPKGNPRPSSAGRRSDIITHLEWGSALILIRIVLWSSPHLYSPASLLGSAYALGAFRATPETPHLEPPSGRAPVALHPSQGSSPSHIFVFKPYKPLRNSTQLQKAILELVSIFSVVAFYLDAVRCYSSITCRRTMCRGDFVLHSI